MSVRVISISYVYHANLSSLPIITRARRMHLIFRSDGVVVLAVLAHVRRGPRV
jgi:hypothetical protein